MRTAAVVIVIAVIMTILVVGLAVMDQSHFHSEPTVNEGVVDVANFELRDSSAGLSATGSAILSSKRNYSTVTILANLVFGTGSSGSFLVTTSDGIPVEIVSGFQDDLKGERCERIESGGENGIKVDCASDHDGSGAMKVVFRIKEGVDDVGFDVFIGDCARTLILLNRS